MNKPLTSFQLDALARLARTPNSLSAHVEPATISLLRKRGLVGRVVTKEKDGRQKTLSPITDEGRALLVRNGIVI